MIEVRLLPSEGAYTAGLYDVYTSLYGYDILADSTQYTVLLLLHIKTRYVDPYSTQYTPAS